MVDQPNSSKEDNTSKRLVSKVDRYTEHACNNLVVGVARDGKPFAYVCDHRNRLVMTLRGRKIRQWLRKEARSFNEFLREDDVNDVIENLVAIASVEDERQQIHTRVGLNEDGDPELDIANPERHRVRFKDGLATVVEKGSKSLFNQPEAMLALPTPASSGHWNLLLPFLNLDENQQHLLLGCITFYMTHPKGTAPYPLVAIIGPQGCGKSMLSRLIRVLVDNNAAGIQLFPKELRDMAISSLSQYILIYDNVREITEHWSDYLCVFSTSGSISPRTLFTDEEQTLLSVHAPIILNGISSFIREPDLASRVITFRPKPIEEGARRNEKEIVQELEEKLPAIFRGVIDLAAQILSVEETATVVHPERMLHFCKWLAAMELVLKLQPGKLQLAYSENLRDSALESVSDNPLAVTILKFAYALPDGKWVGTSTQLLVELSRVAPAGITHRKSDWPQSAISLSKRLKQVAPIVKPQGLDIAFFHGTQRQIEICYTPPQTTESIEESEELDDGALQEEIVSTLTDCTPNAQSGE